MLIKDVASEFPDRVKVVTEEYGNSPTAQKWGVRRYPVVFVQSIALLHQAMIAMEEASVSFQLMVEVRNKLLESYQELMRMQI